MKALLLAVLLILPFVPHGLAKTRPLPDVPPSALTITQVLDLARKDLGNKADAVILVGVDWCKTSQFQPRYTTGGEFYELHQNPDEYCWFVTYLDKKADPALPADQQKKVREMTVLRIKNNGTVHRLGMVRT